MKTRIIVAGCRDFHGYQFIEETLDAYIKPLEGKVEILSGSAPGVDQLGEHYAIAHNLPLLRFPAGLGYTREVRRPDPEPKNGKICVSGGSRCSIRLLGWEKPRDAKHGLSGSTGKCWKSM